MKTKHNKQQKRQKRALSVKRAKQAQRHREIERRTRENAEARRIWSAAEIDELLEKSMHLVDEDADAPLESDRFCVACWSWGCFCSSAGSEAVDVVDVNEGLFADGTACPVCLALLLEEAKQRRLPGEPARALPKSLASSS